MQAVTNGLIWNGLYVYASEVAPLVATPAVSVQGIIESNIEYRNLRQGDPMDEYLIFGEDSVVFFTYHIPEGAYEVITIVGMSVLKSYGTFDELLVDAFGGHL